MHPNRHLISVDEKTGIQALERKEGRAPQSKGGHKRKEFEYKRNGTTCLLAAFDVGKGNIPIAMTNPTRTEKDFLNFIIQVTNCYPKEDEVVLMADHLNIHLSESLVVWIAESEGIKDYLGKKGKEGILKNKETRREFLEKEEHRIRFLFTPKHCSWLNPVENWFAKLQTQMLTNGNFSSVDKLTEKIAAYVKYYNACLVKPFNWKFNGFEKNKKLSINGG